jgi:hypothetical protein
VCHNFILSSRCTTGACFVSLCALITGETQAPLNVLSLMDALEALAFPETVVDLVAEHFGLQETVALEELHAATASVLPGRDLVRLRRMLDPTVSSNDDDGGSG